MKCVCPECKNEVNLASYPNFETGSVIECEMCGITLAVTAVDDDKVGLEVVDEGK